ncbi:MAG: phytanoyl-CoA dioxygenase family protein, partial [Acidobacteria bacterium]|nr:phytanoyl-CoA dioxygenase family protein [Acidobacteriota bacterium]
MHPLERNGYAVANVVLAAAQCERIAASLPAAEGLRGGVRNLLTHPTVTRLVANLGGIVEPGLVAVKATLFDKRAEANWRVAWHQDRAIAVAERVDIEDYGPWSTKAGVVHVEPPAEVLAQMLAIRIHLDDCGPENGPLRLLPATHRLGKLGDDAIAQLAASLPFVELHLPQGAMLLMRPLLLH